MTTRNTAHPDVFPLRSAPENARHLRDENCRSGVYLVLIPLWCPHCRRDEVFEMLTRAASPAEAMDAADAVFANRRTLVEWVTGIRCEDDQSLAGLYGNDLYQAVGLKVRAPVITPFPE